MNEQYPMHTHVLGDICYYIPTNCFQKRPVFHVSILVKPQLRTLNKTSSLLFNVNQKEKITDSKRGIR
jgi:hypothetical protein